MSEENTRYVDQAGRYTCVVKKPNNGWFGEAGEKQTPFLRIPCVVQGGPQAGREITYSAWLSDAAFDRSITTLSEAFGWDGNLVALEGGQFSFAGLQCEISAEAEAYNGETRVKAKWLNPVGGGGGEKLAAEKVSGLIARLGSKAKAIAKATGAVAAKPVAPAAVAPAAGAPAAVAPAAGDAIAAVEGDDIPF